MLSIGLMSGTSMDGIDAALIRTDGKVDIEILGNESLSYDPDFKILLKAAEYAVRKYKGNLNSAKNFYQKAIEEYLRNEYKLHSFPITKKLKALAVYFHGNENSRITFDHVIQRSTELHAKLVKLLLEKTHYQSDQIDVIGYHGQTLFHQPSAKITIQVGNGPLLAEFTGITVVDNFRSRDVKAGGQGAPFAPLYHQALAVRDNKYPLVIVNCGGIANITVITGPKETEVIGFDTGPGNGLIDRYIKRYTQGKESMDSYGQYGNKGKVNEEIFKLLYHKAIKVEEENYFAIKPPKSLDIGDLILIPELAYLSVEDACATLEAFTADTIVNSIDYLEAIEPPKFWILAGGGWSNPVIYKELQVRLQQKLGLTINLITADEIGWDSKTLEAQTFAYLAIRSLQGMPISVPGTTRVPEPLSGGEIHFPPKGATTSLVNEMLKANSTALLG